MSASEARHPVGGRLTPDTAALAEDIAAWLPGQRWFSGKARATTGIQVVDFASLGARLVLVLVEVSYDDGDPERYQIPLAVLPEKGSDVVTSAGGFDFVDAMRNSDACRRLAFLTRSGDRLETARGALLEGEALGEVTLPDAVRSLGVEQSNSSVVLGDRVLLKLYRRIEPGENPEVELTRALTEEGAEHVPALRGALTLAEPDGTTTTLAVLSDFVARGREGWALAVEEARGVARGPTASRVDEEARGVARGPTASRVNEEARGVVRGPVPEGGLTGRMRELGVAVAEVHGLLRRRLGVREATRQDVASWRQASSRQLARVLAQAERRNPEAAGPVLAKREALERALGAMGDAPDPGPLIRIHGDLHLAQVMLDAQDRWQVLDFEGEPARSRDERRAPAAALRDVAGMLRSFDYVVGHAVLEGAEESVLAPWRDGLRTAFLDGYLPVAREAAVLPSDDRSARLLLDAFELDKAIYELGYELANRPDWVRIPVGGILRVLERAHQRPEEGLPMPTPSRPGRDAVADDTATDDVVVLPTAGPRSTDPGPTPWRAAESEVTALLEGRHGDPHRLLGVHEYGDGAVVRVYRPDAESVEVVLGDESAPAERTHPGGFFEARLETQPTASEYRLRVRYPGGAEYELWDAYAFWPTLGEVDLHLAGEGRHEELWRRMGAHVGMNEGVLGTSFAVWAPTARSVRVVGDWNSWDGRLNPMRRLGSSGIWEVFVPDVGTGTYYKYEIATKQGHLVTRADPFAFATDVPPGTASRVWATEYLWADEQWMDDRGGVPITSPMSTYEVHLGSWRYRDGLPLTYREMADDLVGHVTYLGFTHVEFLPVAEHPFGGSWGYQVTGYFAPTARFGNPDDFRYLVDRLHQAGIGVIVDWVPAHFPRDEWALARFDGSALYEHEDPRQGEHPDWGTLVFNFGRNEVRNFLIANALYWLEELHVDGLRVDAVASMLYLDYSREEGQWVPNRFGGRENLEAVEFMKDLNRTVYGRNPHAMMIAEESTDWPGVSRPAHLGGLGFGFKWNMGWMHDTLSYFSKDAIYRRYHHNQLTFSLMYAFSENFILPLSHDEVVHGKRALIDKMPGDRWQKFANLRALYGYMWAHPGKQLLFMGCEFGQWREWSESRELDWYLLGEPDHNGVQAMVSEMNARYRDLPALWQRDSDPLGFTWIDANNADDNMIAFVRFGEPGTSPVVCLCNFAPVARRMRVGLPELGTYREVLNTDAAGYGGGNVGNMGAVHAEPESWHGQPASAEVTLPPLATVWLTKG